MTAYDCYVSLGANLGERERSLRRALELLAGTAGVELWQVSSFYETAPWGKKDQPPFINLAARLRVTLPPLVLLDVCQEIEYRLGRVRHEHWGARTMDIDLIDIPGVVSAEERLRLPHPYLKERAFVLVPLAEIAGEHVIDGRRVEELLSACQDDCAVSKAAGSPTDFSLSLLACVDEDWGLGKDGRLLFHLPEDMAEFRRRTMGQNVILGRRTLESLPEGKPLPGRYHFVLSHQGGGRPFDGNGSADGGQEAMVRCNSLEALWQKLRAAQEKYPQRQNFLLGGGQVYRQLLPYVKEAFITKVAARQEADVFLENLDGREDFVCRECRPGRDATGLSYEFRYYVHGKSGGLDGDFQE